MSISGQGARFVHGATLVDFATGLLSQETHTILGTLLARLFPIRFRGIGAGKAEPANNDSITGHKSNAFRVGLRGLESDEHDLDDQRRGAFDPETRIGAGGRRFFDIAVTAC
jgi:hypothetical protein